MPKVCPHALLYNRIKSGKIKVHQGSPVLLRFWNRVDKNGPVHPTLKTRCWEWTGSYFSSGYGQIWINFRNRRAHRYVWTLYYGSIADELHIIHRCDNPKCVNPRHLRLGNNQANVKDREDKLRSAKGEVHGRAKLTEVQVREIRLTYESQSVTKGLLAKLAKVYGVTSPTIYKIIHHINWRSIQ